MYNSRDMTIEATTTTTLQTTAMRRRTRSRRLHYFRNIAPTLTAYKQDLTGILNTPAASAPPRVQVWIRSSTSALLDLCEYAQRLFSNTGAAGNEQSTTNQFVAVCQYQRECIKNMLAAPQPDPVLLRSCLLMMREWNHPSIRSLVLGSRVYNPYLPLLAHAHALQIAQLF